MRIKLDSRFVEQLAEQPESGMGYQRVDIRLADGRKFDAIVFNAEEVDIPDEMVGAQIVEVRLQS